MVEEGDAVPDDRREPLIPRPAIMLIALALTGTMIYNVVHGGDYRQTLALGGVVCATFGFGWVLDWVRR